MKSKLLKKVMVLLMAALLTMSVPMVVFADETTAGSGGGSGSGVADFLEQGDENGGLFAPLVDKVKGLGQDAYQLVLVVGIVCLVLSLAVLGITTALTKRSQTQQDNKGWAVRIAIGGCVLFGTITIVGLIATIAGGF